MKLTFIVPPCFDHKQAAERTAGCTRVVYLAPNIYELTVAAVLEKADKYEVKYRDFVYSGENREAFEDFIGNDDSDIYLMWTVNLSIETDLEAIKIIRKRRGAVKVVLMGPGPTHFVERCLPDCDVYVVRGEPEETVAELVGNLSSGTPVDAVRGLSWRDAEGVHNNLSRPLIRDLDSLPFPARHLLGGAVYRNPKLVRSPYTTMVTSRNCPHHCIFCVPSSLTFAREIESRGCVGGASL